MSAYFKLDESSAGTAADSSGDANPGTVTGATASTDVPTTSFANSRSLSFDGNDYVSAASSAELNPTDLTLSFWFKLNATSGIQTLVAKWDINAYQQYVIQSSGNTLYFYTGDGSNVTADTIAHSQTLSAGVWYHAVGTITGTARCLSINGAQECDTADTTLGSSSEPLTIGSKQLTDGAFVEYLNGYIDDVRVYSRVLGGSELTDLAAGDHTAAVWDGSASSNYDTAANWDTGAVPDPYTLVTIADTVNHPQASADISLGGLTIQAGARLSLSGWDFSINDSGDFSNNGTLQLRNSETLTGFSNDTDSGTILLTPDADISGLKTGNSYNNLIINDSTFAHWPLDNSGTDVSGFGNDIESFSSTTPEFGSASSHDNYGEPTADIPAGTVEGDLLVAYVYGWSWWYDPVTRISPSAGWTVVDRWFVPGDESQGVGLFYKIATDSEPSTYTFMDDEASNAILGIARVEAGTFDPDNPIDTFALNTGDTSGASVNSESITPSVDGSLGIGFFLANVDQGWTPPAGWDEQLDDQHNDFSALIATETLTTSPTGVLTATASGSLPDPDLAATAIVAITPATGGGSASYDPDVPVTEFANSHSGSFDGSSEFYSFDTQELPDNATWCAWAKINSGDGAVLGSAGGQYSLAIIGGNEVRVKNAEDGTEATWNIGSVYGSWHHFCVTQTTTITASLDLYLDGTVVGSSETLADGAGEIDTIGRGGSYYLNGLIDDVRIYSRTLTPTEIDRIFDGAELATYVSTQTLNANLAVGGDLTISSGRLDVSSSDYDISIDGDLRNDGGVFVSQEGTVVLTGTDQSINSSFSFYDLEKTVAAAATLTFGKDSTIEVTNMLTLQGDVGELLSLRSSTPGTQWLLNPLGDETVAYLDVQDSYNIDTEPVDITGANVTDSGNNVNWTINVAPDDPTSLGPTQYINASYGNDSTPTLTFSLADDNPVDDLRFRVQIDNNNDFSSPEVDYTSDLDEHGARSFTVGQNGSDDTYTVGSDSMTMVSGDYYWRVQAIDDYDTPNQSGYTVASGGSVAFRLDITGPTTPGTPTTSDPGTDRTPAWSWSASTDAGVGLANPIYSLQWSTDINFSSYSAATTNSTGYTHGTNLADGQWYFRVRASDTLGNHSAWATSAAQVIDNTGPSTPVAPFTASPTGIPTPTWSWSAPTDAGVGLHPTTPYILNWSLTSNFSGTVYNTTHNSNIFVHSTNLADGTWYMRVKAVDALGNESSWSSNGSVLIDGTAPSLPGMPTTTDPTNNDLPTWNWDASIDSGSGLSATPYTVQWSSETDFSPLGGSTSSATNSYTHGTELADGTWYIRVSARDVLSNQSGWSATGEVTIDTVDPDIPDTPSTTTPTNNDTPEWTWPVPDDNVGGVGLAATPYTVEWSQDSDFNSVEDSETSSTNTFTHDDSLAEGTWYFRVNATDLAGNTSDWSDNGTVYIDKTAPTIPGDPSTADPVGEDNPTWTWDESTDSGIGLDTPPYEVRWSTDNTFNVGVSNDTAATESYTHSTELADGTWYFQVRAVDEVGNESDWSNAGSKVVDDGPPTVPGTPTTTTPTNDNSPAWNWTASTDAGVGLHATPYMIEWSQDNTFLGGVSSDTITPNSFTHSTPLADGTWYFRVRAQDSVGNISGYSANGTVVVDATDPSIPGTPATSDPTTDDTPMWTWTASTDAGVGLANPAYTVEWSTASDFSAGPFSATSNTNSYTHTANLADGTWHFRVRATDLVGNVSDNSTTGSVEIDDTAPSVPGTPSTATPTDDTTPAWSWTASTDNGVGLADPEYEVNWSQVSNFSAGIQSSNSTTNSFTHSTPLADGTWYFRVRTFDQLGNMSSWSSNGTVLISTAGPTAPGTPSTSTPTTDTTPAWTWTASSSPAGLANPAYTVEWSQDNTFLSGVSSDPININSFTHDDVLTDGIWYFRVIAEDNTGLFSPYSATGSVLVDTTAPTFATTLTYTTPTGDDTPLWSWGAASDAGSGLAATPYEIEWAQVSDFSGGVQSGTSASTGFSPSTPLADGTWYIRVRATDAVNNASGWIPTSTQVIDTTAPTVPGEPDTTTPTDDTTPAWTWSASSDSGVGLDDPAYELQWSQYSDFSTGIISDTDNDTGYTHLSPLGDGSWYIRVRAVDAVGNQSAWSASGEVEVDDAPPVVPGTPTTGGLATNDTTPTWTWSGSSDSGSGLASQPYEVEWSQDSNFLSGVSNDTASSASFTHDTDLGAGTWYLRVRAVDAVGNQSGWSGNGSVVVDTDLPSSPGAPDTDTPTIDTTPTWTWTESIDDGFGFGASPYEVQWSQASDFSSGVSDSTSAEESFTHSTPLADGTWYFRVRAVDGASNPSAYSGNGTVQVDSTAPTAPDNLTTDTPTKDSTPAWSWDASTDSGVGLQDPAYEFQWSLSSNFLSGVSSATSNDANFTHVTPLDFGIWHFRVRATDQLGNNSAWETGSVNIDNIPPVISSVDVSTGTDSATVSWTTDEPASTQAQYGVADKYDVTTNEVDTSPRVTSHSATISGLTACSTFRFRPVSVDSLDNQAVGSGQSFTTRGCSGNAAVMSQANGFVNKDTGGSVTLTPESGSVSLSVPAGFSAQSADFQIKQLSPSAGLDPIGQPAGRSLVGSHVYDLKSLASPSVNVTSFAGSITMTITYTSPEAAGFNLSSLAIFRYDGSSWQQLTGCVVGAVAHEVRCQTTAFSVFGLFGVRSTPAPPLPEGDGVEEPEPEAKPEENQPGQVGVATEDNNGLAAAFTRITSTIAKRPVWWISALLLIIAATTLLFIRHKHRKKELPFGIHKDDK